MNPREKLVWSSSSFVEATQGSGSIATKSLQWEYDIFQAFVEESQT